MFIDIKPGEYYHRDTYERLYDWDTLKGLVDSGDLAYLKRHPSFQRDYDEWTKETIKHEGPMVNILLRRLGWNNIPAGSNDTDVGGITKLEYFTADIQDELVRVVINDWPYSVPPDATHFIIWSRLPFIHEGITPYKVKDRVAQNGLWGFTGGITQPKAKDKDVPLIRQASREIQKFVEKVWPEDQWETAWFVNPLVRRKIMLCGGYLRETPSVYKASQG